MNQDFNGTDAIIAEMLRTLPPGSGVQIPPPAFATMGIEFLKYLPGVSLSASFPASAAFANPMGVYLGAAIGAAIDMLFGSLAFLELRQPCTTVNFDMAFVRPLPADGNRYRCEAVLRAKTKRFIFLEGRAFRRDDKLCATAAATMVLLSG